MAFVSREVFPGVWHITDAMGVCMTLIAGENAAVLFDCGYGIENVREYVGTLTDRPVRVLLSHIHHDHALGARWFSETWMLPEDLPYMERYTGLKQREEVRKASEARGLVPEGDFLNDPIAVPRELKEEEIDLGGIHVRVIACPGHTPGSAAVLVPEYKLLLTGDDWNPCTWVFFPEALGIRAYLKNLREILLPLAFEKVLCPHREALYDRKTMEKFADALTEEAIVNAPPSQTGEAMGIRTAAAVLPEEQVIVFDRDKETAERRVTCF